MRGVSILDCYTNESSHPISIKPLIAENLSAWLEAQDKYTRQWVEANEFKAKPGETCCIPDQEGQIKLVLLGVDSPDDFWVVGDLPARLAKNDFLLENENNFYTDQQYRRCVMAWGLGSYQYNAYIDREKYGNRLLTSDVENFQSLQDEVAAIYLVRDLINTPTEDMGPEELAAAVSHVGEAYDADVNITVGDDLLAQGYNAIHAVGRAGARPPRLIDLTWGNEEAPKVTLVGKGVCFDSGGLNIKPAGGMRTMKKDMAGAAHALGLAQLVMANELPVRLRLLIPAVENAVGSQSYRPGDVITTKAGITVEVDNTDAEGRLVVCDAFADAVAESPDCIIDFTTLTGAARVALGPDVPVMFANNEELANSLIASGEVVKDMIWQLPLHQPYREFLKSDIADLQNCANTRYGGAITAALYLETFISKGIPWAHFDIMAANTRKKPGRPKGGEAMGLRATFHYLQNKFS